MQRLLLLGLMLAAFSVPAETNAFKRTEDVVYARKYGMAQTFDIFRPEKPNGVGIVLILSAGWNSDKSFLDWPLFKALYGPLVEHGYTVFAVLHGAQPRFSIEEIIPDVHRAVRFVRHHAAENGIDPKRIGVMGASAGGHLSLSMATRGTNGIPDAKDPVDRESSVVQCVACLFPPTDFVNYGAENRNAFVGTNALLKSFAGAFGPSHLDEAQQVAFSKSISPIAYVTGHLPPTLIIHGDADKLVPYQQSERFVKRAEELKNEIKLVRRPGRDHGWQDFAPDGAEFLAWFDSHLLRGQK